MILDGEAIVQRWSALLAGCAQEAPGIYALVMEHLKATKVPGLVWWQESVAASFLTELLGKRQDALVIKLKAMPEWPVVILSEPFGHDLNISWLLLVSPKRLRDFRRVLRFAVDRSDHMRIGSEISPLARLRFDGFLQLTRRAVQSAIAQLGREDELAPEVGATDEVSID